MSDPQPKPQPKPQPLSIESMQRLYEQLNERSRQAFTEPRYDFTFRCTSCKKTGFAAVVVARCPFCGNEAMAYADRNWEHLGWHDAKTLVSEVPDK